MPREAALPERPEALDHLGAGQAPVHGHAVVVAVVLVERALDGPPRLGRRAATPLQGLDRGVHELVVGHHAGDEAPVDGLGSRHRAAGHQHVAGAGRADLAGQHLGVVGVGDAAQQLGRPEDSPVAGDGHVGEHGDHQATALGDAVDRAHDRLGRAAHGVERRVVHRQQAGQVHPAVVVGTAEVASGHEHVADAGHEQAVQVGLGVDAVDGVADAEVHGRRQGVAHLGPVDDEVGQRAVPLEPQVGSPHPVAFGRARCSRPVGHAASGPATCRHGPAPVRPFRHGPSRHRTLQTRTLRTRTLRTRTLHSIERSFTVA